MSLSPLEGGILEIRNFVSVNEAIVLAQDSEHLKVNLTIFSLHYLFEFKFSHH